MRLHVVGRPDVDESTDVREEEIFAQPVGAHERVLRVEWAHLVRGEWEAACIEYDIGLELHTAESVDVGVAVPEVRLHVRSHDLAIRLPEVALRE